MIIVYSLYPDHSLLYSEHSLLYPELFRILWQSTLPCFNQDHSDHMLLDCLVNIIAIIITITIIIAIIIIIAINLFISALWQCSELQRLLHASSNRFWDVLRS